MTDQQNAGQHPRKPVSLIPTKHPRFHTFEPVPDGFLAHRASDEDLERFGMPRRPDPKTCPRAARTWHHVMRRIKKWVPVEFKDVPGLKLETTMVSHNWSGTVVKGYFTDVWATWTQPSCWAPPTSETLPGSNAADAMAMWVGIGGVKGTIDADNILQVGTIHGLPGVIGSTFVFQTGAVATVMDMVLVYGDAVAVMCGAYGSTEVTLPFGGGQQTINRVYYQFANLSQGLGTQKIVVDLPLGASAPSSSAEWIVEAPFFNADSPTPLQTFLSDYGMAVMTDVGASGAGGLKVSDQTLAQIAAGDTIENFQIMNQSTTIIVDVNGQEQTAGPPISTAEILPSTIRFAYLGIPGPDVDPQGGLKWGPSPNEPWDQ